MVVNLSENRIAINFSKNAIAGLRDGKSFAVDIKKGRSSLRFVFMRTSAFKEKMAQFKQSDLIGDLSFWGKVKRFFGRFSKLSILPSGKYKETDR